MFWRRFARVADNWSEINEHGVFTVWAIGYVENDKEIPKKALIFKNGEFVRIAPYGSKDDLRKQYLF